MRKCVVLLSGGLDSLLATRLMAGQGVETTALHTVNCFHGTQNLEEKKNRLRETALRLGAADIVFRDITDDVVALTKNPPHGHGKNMNPCIDCRLRTVREGFALMRELGADFVVTGEVSGQRPMSQRRDALGLADRTVAGWGFGGLLLRPLCAKLLPKTVPETEGWVDPERLYDISGRSRDRQMALAKELDLGDYPSPAGGCLLTDPGYSDRLKFLMRFKPDWDERDAELLKVGRHFQISPTTRLVASRREEENRRLEQLAEPEDFLYINAEKFGAIILLRGEVTPKAEQTATGLAIYFSKMRGEGKASVRRWRMLDGVDADTTVVGANEIHPDRVRETEQSLT